MATAQLAEWLKSQTDLMREQIAADSAKVRRLNIRLLPREQAIVNTIGDGTIRAQVIANALDLENTGSFRDTLALLTRFGILSNEKAGYSVTPECAHLIQEQETSEAGGGDSAEDDASDDDDDEPPPSQPTGRRRGGS